MSDHSLYAARCEAVETTWRALTLVGIAVLVAGALPAPALAAQQCAAGECPVEDIRTTTRPGWTA